MASANLDLVRSIYADWERGDFSSTLWAHPEMEVVFADGLAPGSADLADMRREWRDFLSAWDGVTVEIAECRELDDERVFVLARWSGQGKASGLELAQTQPAGANVFHIRDGSVTRLVLYWSRHGALADLGLAPEAAATNLPD
jgi:ketosteroid isomerase-like protein